MIFDSNRFINDKYTSLTTTGSLFERNESRTEDTFAQSAISEPLISAKIDNKNWFNILIQKRISSQDTTISKTEKEEKEMQSLLSGSFSYGVDEEANELIRQLDQEAQLKFLQMYYDSYMSPEASDLKWRLGDATGVVMGTAHDDELGTIQDGAMYTRSNFAVPFEKYFWSNGKLKKTTNHFSTLFFPPYRVGPKSPIKISKKPSQNDGSSSFNLDTFKLTRADFTYRGAGFKAINDNIHFLQWITEGVTGIVSTYLTEWDLSLYMQEGLLTPQANGEPLKLYLNYRIEKDNPLSHNKQYQGEKSLVFNVTGSAVSKLFYDCQSPWRPSDHPHSSWWVPYAKGKDWDLKDFELNDEEDPSNNINIKYMSIYDSKYSAFNYSSNEIKDILKHQDYIGTILGCHPNFKLKYYQSMYYTSGDIMTDFEVKLNDIINQIAGADKGEAKENGLSIDDLVRLSKEEMLLNGGYSGGPSPAGIDASSVASRMAIQDAINIRNAGTGKVSMRTILRNMTQKRNAGMNQGLKTAEMAQKSGPSTGSITGYSNQASDFLNSFSGKLDASVMAKYPGINRFSPALYGGPHGAEYSPSTGQAYFDENSILIRNVARITPSAKYYEKNNSKYRNSNSNGKEPRATIDMARAGLPNFRQDIQEVPIHVTEFIDEELIITGSTFSLRFPTHKNGKEITWIKKRKSYWFFGWRYRNVYVTKTKRIKKEMSFPAYYLLQSKNSYNAYRRGLNLKKNLEKRFKVTNYRREGTQMRYTLEYSVLSREAGYIRIEYRPFKNYFLHDMPDTKWSIYQHTVGKNSTNNKSSSFWKNLKVKGLNVDNTTKNLFLRVLHNTTKNLIKSKNYVLRFQNSETERKVITYMLGINKGRNPSAKLIFCEGNEGGRYSKGPRSFFRAQCTVKSFRNLVRTPVYRRFLWWRWISHYNSVSYYTPYIDVDMSTVDFFEDNVHIKPYSNKDLNGHDVPIHLQSMDAARTGKLIESKFHPLQRFEDRKEDILKNNGNTGLWSSRSTMGISGIGILSSIQGVDPVGHTNPLVRLPAGSLEKPIKSLSFKTHKKSKWSSVRWDTINNITWWSPEPNISYTSSSVDEGLKKAILNMYTRATFFTDQEDGDSKPLFVGLDVPVRNFLSAVAGQLSYFYFLKGYVDSVSFEVLHVALDTCVDKCVLKASGRDAEGNSVDPDKDHVLYSYWIEQAIKLFGNKKDLTKNKKALQSAIELKIVKLEACIEQLKTSCAKSLEDWSYKEILDSYKVVQSAENIFKRDEVETFLFSYLHILYNYRFFFIAKRFNKEDGTMWIMRALESVIDQIVKGPNAIAPPPPPLSMMLKDFPSYKIAFYELQNSSDDKRAALINNTLLEEDRIKKVYVKVEWVEKEDYLRWLRYKDNPIDNFEVSEVIKIEHNKIVRYAKKPEDGMYQLVSKEWTKNEMDKLWNKNHPEKPRVTKDYDEVRFNINWGDSEHLTPIRWNIFDTINLNGLLEYSSASVSAEELVCLIEEGADFWTVSIPEHLLPRATGYQNEIKLEAYRAPLGSDVGNDAAISLLGPSAYSVYPIGLAPVGPPKIS